MVKMLLIGRVSQNILEDFPDYVEIIHITRKNDIKYGLGVFNRPEKTILMDYDDKEELKKICFSLHQTYKFDCVYAFTEEGLLPAAIISKYLRLPGLNVDVVNNTKNKYIMRKILEKEPEINVPFVKISNFLELESFVNEHKRIILKPIDSFGSKGVLQISRDDNLIDGYEYCKKYSDDLIAEKYISGMQVSVEAFSENGKHKILAITEKKCVILLTM